MLDDRKTELVKRLSSKPGYAGKVAAKCIECIYDPLSGNGHWRQQVAACAIYSCPLYAARPKSTASDTLKDDMESENDDQNIMTDEG